MKQQHQQEFEEITKDLQETVKRGVEAQALLDKAKELMKECREKEAYELFEEWKRIRFK